mgnify:FL=1
MEYRKSYQRHPAKLAPTGYEWFMGTVTEIKDGDTICFSADRRVHVLRLLGVDSPEMGKKDAKNEFYSRACVQFLADLVLKKPVRALLTVEPVMARKKLGYLFVPGDEVSVNERMVAAGYAFASRSFSFPEQAHYLGLETAAREKRIGMWKEPPRLSPGLGALLEQ